MAQEQQRPIGSDAAGYELIREAVRSLLNSYPGLETDEKVKYDALGKESGLIFTDTGGALVYTEVFDIVGNVRQTCSYPFYVVYRSTATEERTKLNIQRFLDNFGAWITGEPVELNGKIEQLTAYPILIGARRIEEIKRDNSYGTEPQENGVQDWVLPVTVRYSNKTRRLFA